MELDSFKGSGSKSTGGDKSKSVAPAAVTVDSDHVSYQLFYRPEQAKFSNTARVRLPNIFPILSSPIVCLAFLVGYFRSSCKEVGRQNSLYLYDLCVLLLPSRYLSNFLVHGSKTGA